MKSHAKILRETCYFEVLCYTNVKEIGEYVPTFSFSSIGSALEMNGHSISTSNSGYFWPEIVTKRTIIWFLVYLSLSLLFQWEIQLNVLYPAMEMANRLNKIIELLRLIYY